MTPFTIAYLIAVAVFTPLVYPTLPLDTALLDFLNLSFLFAFAGYVALNHQSLQARLYVPWLIIFTGSLISMLNSRALGSSAVTLAQDIYLFIFFLLLYNVIDRERHLKTLVLSWIVVAILEGALAVAGVVGNFSLVPSPDLTRAQGTFSDSNAAASYLGISFFLVFQPYLNLNVLWKIAGAIFIFGGMFATKSLSAALGFVVGNMVIFSLYWLMTGLGTRVKLAFIILTVAIVALEILPRVVKTENFLDRSPRSAEERFVIWEPAYKCFLEHPFGIGPGAFVEVGGGPFNLSGPPNKKGTRAELHNDYLASLVERGIVGFIGHIALLGTMVSMLSNCIKRAQSDRELLWALGLCGMFCFVLIDALTHEGLHYRHVWLVFAMIAVQDKFVRQSLSGMTGILRVGRKPVQYVVYESRGLT